MRDLNIIFRRAKNKKIFSDDVEVENFINSILQIDNTICVDWDMTAGEDWVRLFRQGSGLVCMFHRKIGVAFARLSEADIFLKKELSRLYVVEVGDYNLEEWSVDLFELHECVPTIIWNASPNAVDTDKMSLNDLYFATV